MNQKFATKLKFVSFGKTEFKIFFSKDGFSRLFFDLKQNYHL